MTDSTTYIDRDYGSMKKFFRQSWKLGDVFTKKDKNRKELMNFFPRYSLLFGKGKYIMKQAPF